MGKPGKNKRKGPRHAPLRDLGTCVSCGGEVHTDEPNLVCHIDRGPDAGTRGRIHAGCYGAANAFAKLAERGYVWMSGRVR